MDVNLSKQAASLGINTSQAVIKSPIDVGQNLHVAALQEQVNYEEDEFWPRPKTQITKWDKYCPYQLLVVKTVPNIAGVPEAGVSYQPYLDWRYTLPLPPDSFSISSPFAIDLSITLNGAMEQHNGSPIRTIMLRGTTGFSPGRVSGGDRSGTGALSQLERIFGGTISNIKSAVSSLNQAGQALTNSAPAAYNVYQEANYDINSSISDSILAQSTGFYQMALLRDFFDCYMAKKKINDAEAQTLRLAVAIWKEDQVFLVTPITFDATKDSSSPLEYHYTLVFKAWKRIMLDVRDASNDTNFLAPPIRRSPNLIAAAINTLTAARKAVQRIGTLKQAVLGDIDYVFKPFHDTILLGKDLLGSTLSLAEIPLAIKQRISINVLELKNNAPQLWNQITSSQTWDPAYKALKYSIDDSTHFQDLPAGTRSSSVTQAHSEGRAASTTSAGIKPRRIALKDLPDELSSQIPLSALNLGADVKKDILNDLNRVRKLRRKDFEDYANTVRNTADKIAFLVGAGDPTYAETYGIDVAPIKTAPTTSDWDSLKALDNSVAILQQFAATADGEPDQGPTLLERFGGLAAASGIAWKQPISKFAIPFPYGATLENLASTYLKNPNRYMEIVALNGLRAPYVDEVGYALPILVNGKDKTVVVNANNDLFVGKTVWLSSQAANRIQYTIESIQLLNGVATLKLNDTVDQYKTNDAAVLEGFLTGTICSRNLIWIPSDITPVDTESVVTKDIPGVDTTDPMVSIGGVDFLLGGDNDLVLVDGDLRYAIGLANIVQWVKTVFSIEKGELIQHKELGVPLSIGLSLADFSAQDTLNTIKAQLSSDPMFSRIDKISVIQKGPAVDIQIQAVVAGTSYPMPLNYGLKLS